MKKMILPVGVTILLIILAFSGCFEEKNNDKKPEKNHVDNITIINNCSEDLEGFLDFEVYEDKFYTKEVGASTPAYNVSYNISIKEGETETYVITVPEQIDNNYAHLHFEVTCKDNSTTYSRSGPWVNSEIYEIYETGDGIHWKFVDFDM